RCRTCSGWRSTAARRSPSSSARSAERRYNRRMRPTLALALWIAACGSSGSGSDGGGGDDLSGSSTDGASGDAASGDGAIAPPAPICTAPIQLADVSAPTAVVGKGDAGSCTESALAGALTAGGIVTFNC